jgi:transposase
MAAPLRILRPITPEELARAARAEAEPRVRSRLLALRQIVLGQSLPQAAAAIALSERQMRTWVHRFNLAGYPGLRDRPRPGRPKFLPAAREEELRSRLLAGPRAEDRVCALRGPAVRSLLAREFGAHYSLDGTYFLLHRLGFSCLVPRPRHPRSDPAAQAAFKKTLRH